MRNISFCEILELARIVHFESCTGFKNCTNGENPYNTGPIW